MRKTSLEEKNRRRRERYKANSELKERIKRESSESYYRNKDRALSISKARRNKLTARTTVDYPDFQVCSSCKEKLSKDQFSLDHSRLPGLNNKCKNCISKFNAIYRSKNRQKIIKYERAARKKDKARFAGYKATRRSKLESCRNDLQEWQWEVIKYLANYKCLACGHDGTISKLALDHIKAVAKGGEHTADNVQLLCSSCNSKKRTKTADYRTKEIIQFVTNSISEY